MATFVERTREGLNSKLAKRVCGWQELAVTMWVFSHCHRSQWRDGGSHGQHLNAWECLRRLKIRCIHVLPGSSHLPNKGGQAAAQFIIYSYFFGHCHFKGSIVSIMIQVLFAQVVFRRFPLHLMQAVQLWAFPLHIFSSSRMRLWCDRWRASRTSLFRSFSDSQSFLYFEQVFDTPFLSLSRWMSRWWVAMRVVQPSYLSDIACSQFVYLMYICRILHFLCARFQRTEALQSILNWLPGNTLHGSNDADVPFHIFHDLLSRVLQSNQWDSIGAAL